VLKSLDGFLFGLFCRRPEQEGSSLMEVCENITPSMVDFEMYLNMSIGNTFMGVAQALQSAVSV
jgi:hypothetical protein